MNQKKNEVLGALAGPKVGVEWCDSLEDDILANLDQVDCVELIPENFFHDRRHRFIREIGKAGKPVMIHAVELSVGTDEPLNQAHFESILRVADQVNMIDLSDHLCMTDAGGVEIGQLTPLPWSVRAADAACRRIDAIRSRIHVPFLIENIANRFVVPDTELTETQFINLVLRRTGCELLIDLHNLHANAYNFGFDPYEWMDQIDLKYVGGVHLAGGHFDPEGTLVDGHSNPVPDRVWDLYRGLCARVTPACTIVERTENFPEYKDLLAEVGKARATVSPTQTVAARQEMAGVAL